MAQKLSDSSEWLSYMKKGQEIASFLKATRKSMQRAKSSTLENLRFDHQRLARKVKSKIRYPK